MLRLGSGDAIEKLKAQRSDENIRSVNTKVEVNPNGNGVESDVNIDFEKDVNLIEEVFYINKIERRRIERTNEIKFFRADVEFANGIQKSFIVPSYVKFYSSRRGIWVPVEFIRNRDILLDYTGRIVKIADTVQIEDFVMTDYYSIKAAYEVSSEDTSFKDMNFYLNGILANISYNNFNKREEDK